MNEWIWMAVVVAAFWAGQWWGERQALHDVARMIVEDILRWGPGGPVPVARLGKGGDE